MEWIEKIKEIKDDLWKMQNSRLIWHKERATIVEILNTVESGLKQKELKMESSQKELKMEDNQKIEEIKKVLGGFSKFDIYTLDFYVRALKQVDEIVNDK